MDFTRQRYRLVRLLRETHAIKREIVENAFLAVRREEFIPLEYHNYAYENNPLPIGYDATISQPSTIANMIEAAGVSSGEKVLEVGSGRGYLLALLSDIVGPEGKVFGIELVPQLAEISRAKLKKYSNIQVTDGDGWYGLEAEAPFDVIIVSAAAKKIPDKLIAQLRPGGRVVVPVNYLMAQKMMLITKKEDGSYTEETIGLYSFVPLRSR